MGIEQFYSTIEKSDVTKKNDNKLDVTSFFVDFNSIIHQTSSIIIDDMNYLLYRIIDKEINDRGKIEKSEREKEIILRFNLDESELINITKYKKYCDNIYKKIIINELVKYIIFIIEEYLVPQNLEILYISIDGVPSKAKMREQQKRRYMGEFLKQIKQQIFFKYENEIKKDVIRFIFEKNKINGDDFKILISPSTDFMDDVGIMFKSSIFMDKLKKTCPNIKTYICSDQYIPHEGEKKIIDFIKINSDNCAVYSPDSDMPLLLFLLLNDNRITNLHLLRYKQQEKIHTYFDVIMASEKIYNIVREQTNRDLDKNNVINDIVFIFSIFGNDFVPKLDAIHVKHDFEIILEKYGKILDNENEYIVIKNENKFKINQKIFLKLMEFFHMDEEKNLYRNHISKYYKYHKKINKFENLDQLFFNLKNLIKKFNINISLSNILNEIKDTEFLQQLKIMMSVRHMKKNNNDEIDIDNMLCIKTYYDYYISNNKLPFVDIFFRKYPMTFDDYQKEKLNMEISKSYYIKNITNYDIECYKLMNGLDSYKYMFNKSKYDIGKIYIDYKTYDIKKSFKKDIIENYKYVFGEKNAFNYEKIVQRYLESIIWTFDYYYNNYDIDNNFNVASTYMYKYNRAPIIAHICEIIKNKSDNYFNLIHDKLKKYYIPRNKFYNCYEQIIYISPIFDLKYLFNEKIFNIVSKYSAFISLDKYVSIVLNNPNNDILDCGSSLFFGKCYINLLNKFNNINDLDLIRDLRSITYPSDIKHKFLITNDLFIFKFENIDELLDITSNYSDYKKSIFIQ